MAESSKSYNIAGLPNGKWENRWRTAFHSGVHSCKAIQKATSSLTKGQRGCSRSKSHWYYTHMSTWRNSRTLVLHRSIRQFCVAIRRFSDRAILSEISRKDFASN